MTMGNVNDVKTMSDPALRPFSSVVKMELKRALNAGATIRINASGHAQITSPRGLRVHASQNSGRGGIGFKKVRKDIDKIVEDCMTVDGTTDQHISKEMLAGFDKDCKEIVVKAVNDYGWTWAARGKGFIDIVSPDGKKSLSFSPGTKPINPSLSSLRRIIIKHAKLETPDRPEMETRPKTPKTSEPEIVDYKTCSRCEKSKPLAEFSKNSKSRDGKQSWCKQCMSDARKPTAKKHTRSTQVAPPPAPDPGSSLATAAQDDVVKRLETAEKNVASRVPAPVEPENGFVKLDEPPTPGEPTSDATRMLDRIREILGEDDRIRKLTEERDALALRCAELTEHAAACEARANRLQSTLSTLRDLTAEVADETEKRP